MSSLHSNQATLAKRVVTMKDVALMAGVHHTSVSVALNGSSSSAKISDATRQRILEVAEELGYRRNGSAHMTRTGRFGSVALLLTPKQHGSYLPPQLLSGLHDALAEADLTLTVCQLSDEQLTDDTELPKVLRERMCDGLLIDYISQFPRSMVDLIRRHHIPAVWINSKQPQDCIYPDDFEAALRATRQLIEIGHRRITYLDFSTLLNSPEEHYSSRDRSQGYEQAMSEAGLESQVVWGRPIPDADRIAFCREILSGPDRPTAVLGYTHWALRPLSYAVAALGLAVPADLSVMCFGPEQTDFLCGPMTMLIEPQRQIARAAVEAVLGKIADPQTCFDSRSIRFEIQNGHSVRAPTQR